MTLRALRAAYSHMFHPNQDWFLGESFLDREVDMHAFDGKTLIAYDEPRENATVSAATLAAWYVQHPDARAWSRYFWTNDHDRHGQQVYVGVNERGFELHRHIHLTERFGVPAWS